MKYAYFGGVVFSQIIAFSFGTMVGYDKCRQDVVNGITLLLPAKVRNDTPYNDTDVSVAHPH